MRNAVFVLVFLFCLAVPLRAQSLPQLEIPRYELAAQADFHYLNGVGEWGGGIGLRFHFNLTDHVAFDSELVYRQHDLPTLFLATTPPPTISQTTGLFGVRVGKRLEGVGFFAHARAGFLNFGSWHGQSLLSRTTFPAFELGGTYEHYNGPVVLRFDLGALTIPYGGATVTPNPLAFPPQAPGRLGTRVSPLASVGFGIRF